MQRDPWSMDPNTPIDESIYSSTPVGASPVLTPGFTKTRCQGCKRPIILEAADPVEMKWNPTPITGKDLTIAKILGRELLKINEDGMFIRYEHVLGTPDPHSWYLEAHDCLTAPIATTEPSTNKQSNRTEGSWQQETLL